MIKHLTLACAALVGATSALAEPGVNYRAQLRQLLDAPRNQLGGSKTAVIKALGTPERTKEQAGENESGTYRLEYPGTKATVLHSPNFGNQSWLIYLRIEKNLKALKLPLKIGGSETDVSKLLGAPTRISKRAIEYVYTTEESGNDGDTLILELDKGKVQSIEWRYYID